MSKFFRFKDISEGKALNIIQKPILTEKSTTLNQFNQYSFKVNLKATSIEIKNAIEEDKLKKEKEKDLKKKMEELENELKKLNN